MFVVCSNLVLVRSNSVVENIYLFTDVKPAAPLDLLVQNMFCQKRD